MTIKADYSLSTKEGQILAFIPTLLLQPFTYKTIPFLVNYTLSIITECSTTNTLLADSLSDANAHRIKIANKRNNIMDSSWFPAMLKWIENSTIDWSLGLK